MGQGESTSASEVEDACKEDCKECMIMKEYIKKVGGITEKKREVEKMEGKIRSLQDKDVQIRRKIINESNEELNTRCRC
jgi:hypothetical protein